MLECCARSTVKPPRPSSVPPVLNSHGPQAPQGALALRRHPRPPDRHLEAGHGRIPYAAARCTQSTCSAARGGADTAGHRSRLRGAVPGRPAAQQDLAGAVPASSGQPAQQWPCVQHPGGDRGRKSAGSAGPRNAVRGPGCRCRAPRPRGLAQGPFGTEAGGARVPGLGACVGHLQRRRRRGADSRSARAGRGHRLCPAAAVCRTERIGLRQPTSDLLPQLEHRCLFHRPGGDDALHARALRAARRGAARRLAERVAGPLHPRDAVVDPADELAGRAGPERA